MQMLRVVVAALIGITLALPGAVRADSRIVAALSAHLATPGIGETRVLIVQRDGAVKAAHYAPGFSADTRLPSWSMAKTITALALGILIDEGKLDLEAPAPVAAWRTPGDPRGAITLRQLLFMTSGLAHREGNERDGQPIHTADTVKMLFTIGGQNAAAYAAARPLAHPPGARWAYSTGTSQVLAGIVASAITADPDPMRRRAVTAAWFKARLFGPIGLTTPEWDFDASGTFLGGSLVHMSATDYLRLGTFLLDGGRTGGGRQIVAPSWLALLTSGPRGDGNTHYGGHLWLNRAPTVGQTPILFHPRGGTRTIALVGHHGQFIIVDPETQTVVVRLGRTFSPDRAALREALGVLLDVARVTP